ncbi:MAG: tape measure protein [Dechloromonas sp.]|nr:tape measure protein [Dechloromonas sp.]
MATPSVLNLKLVIDGSNKGAIAALAQLNAESQKTSSSLSKLDQSSGGLPNTSRALDEVSAKLNQVRAGALAIGAGLIGANGLADLARLSDEYTSVNSRLKLAASSSADFAKAQAGVFEVAQRNGRELAATATLYGRIAGPMRDMGKNSAETLRITDAVSASLRISGATAAESASAQLQFAQALAAGRLQGEELNAVLEAAPPLAKALATAMHVSVGDLKAMGAEGKLTSKIIAEALLSQAEALTARAAQMESTIGESMTRVRNAFQNAFGGNTSAGAVRIAAGINAIADNMQTLLQVSALTGAGLAAVFGVRLMTSIVATVAAKQALIAAEREAAAMALATAQANLRAAEAEAARTLTTKGLAAAQAQLALAERASTVAAAGAATRAGGALLGLLGGPIGAIATALTLGITAWQIWGNRGEEAAGKAGKSVAELIKEMQAFGANASVQESTKHFQELAAAIKQAREEEEKLRDAARQRAMSDMNIATKAQVEGAVDNDPAVKAAAERRKASEKELQDELTRLNSEAADQRGFIAKKLIEKQKALNGELVTNERDALTKRLNDNVSAATAVRSAWLNTLSEIKSKQAEAAAAPGKAADTAANLKSRTDNVKMSGMSEEDKAAFQGQQAMEARELALADQIRGRFELMKAYSQQLKGDLAQAKTSFDAAEKDLNRAFSQAEKAGDSGLMDEIAAKLVDIEKQKGKVAEGEVKQLSEQGEAQRSKMAELEGASEALKNKLAGMEVQIQIDGAMAALDRLAERAASVADLLSAAKGTGSKNPADSLPTLEPYLPARAYGGELPGWAPHDRADNVIYRGTPGEFLVQRPTVKQRGARAFLYDFNARGMAALKDWIPGHAYGGEIGSTLASRLSVPSVPNYAVAASGSGDRTPLILDFGKLGRVKAEAKTDSVAELTRIFRRARHQFGGS